MKNTILIFKKDGLVSELDLKLNKNECSEITEDQFKQLNPRAQMNFLTTGSICYSNSEILEPEYTHSFEVNMNKPKCPHSLDFDLPKPDFIAKAKEIHNAYSEYKQLLEQKESIREALRECNTRIKEAEENIINIY